MHVVDNINYKSKQQLILNLHPHTYIRSYVVRYICMHAYTYVRMTALYVCTLNVLRYHEHMIKST